MDTGFADNGNAIQNFIHLLRQENIPDCFRNTRALHLIAGHQYDNQRE